MSVLGLTSWGGNMVRALARVASVSMFLWIACGQDLWAQPAPATVVDFPMVGLAPGQTLQFNFATANSCRFNITLFDSQGNTIQTFLGSSNGGMAGRVRHREVQTSRTENRISAFFFPLDPGDTSCPLRVSLEVFDTFSGITTVAVPQLPPIPPGPTGFGPVSMTAFEVARLNLVAWPPDPCVGTLGFLDASGNPIGTTKDVSLGPGTADFLDLTLPVGGLGLFQQSEVLPLFVPTPGADASSCVASVEVYDKVTSRTHAYYSPTD
jgi:hypothetical protein